AAALPPRAACTVRAQAGEQRLPPPAVLLERAGLMPVEEPALAEVVHGGLNERARVDVRQLLGRLEALDQLGGRHDPAQTQAREEDLGERAHVDSEDGALERR